jgi:multimeric flavodoxin WrbA
MAIKVQVIYYSMYGHVYKMAQAIVEGAKQVPGRKSRSIKFRNSFLKMSWKSQGPKRREMSSPMCR